MLRHHPAGSAFTLIELLVAIYIIAMMTALLMALGPSLQRRSQSALCVGNLKTLGQAVLNHAADNNGKSVVAYLDAAHSLTGSPQLWYSVLEKAGYLASGSKRKVLVCPSFSPFQYSEMGSGIMYTYGLRRWDAPDQFEPAWSIGRIGTPSKFILLADSYKESLKQQFYYITYPGFTTSAPEQIHARHGGRANICFGDGSVRSLNKDEILALDDGWKPTAILQQ